MPYANPDLKHYLVITRGVDGNEEWMEWEVEHDENCPQSVVLMPPVDFVGLPGEEFEPVLDFQCGVGVQVAHVGLDDLDYQDLPAGRYEIRFYHYTPTSMYEDAEMYLEFVEEPAR